MLLGGATQCLANSFIPIAYEIRRRKPWFWGTVLFLILMVQGGGHAILILLFIESTSILTRCPMLQRQTIYLWLKRWEECGDITAHRRNFYQRATTAPQDADIVAAHAADPNLSPKIMSNKYRVS